MRRLPPQGQVIEPLPSSARFRDAHSRHSSRAITGGSSGRPDGRGFAISVGIDPGRDRHYARIRFLDEGLTVAGAPDTVVT